MRFLHDQMQGRPNPREVRLSVDFLPGSVGAAGSREAARAHATDSGVVAASVDGVGLAIGWVAGTGA